MGARVPKLGSTGVCLQLTDEGIHRAVSGGGLLDPEPGMDSVTLEARMSPHLSLLACSTVTDFSRLLLWDISLVPF